MWAWRFVAPNKIEPQELPVPKPGPEDALIRISAAGLCRTDLHILSGEWPFKPPLTLGHEGTGTVVSLAPGVSACAVGDRVAVHPINPCGGCGRCLQGRENICEDHRALGHVVDGTFAEFVLCRAAALVPVPEGVADDAAAVTTDAVLTPYHALTTVGGLREGEDVAIFGIGGLGTNAIQIARSLGANVIAVDPFPERLERARELGASETHADGRELRRAVDLAVDLVGSEETIERAQTSARAGGRVVLVGLGPSKAPLHATRYAAEELALLGATSGTRAELARCLDLVAAGTVRPIVERQPFDSVALHVQRLASGRVDGRVVLVSEP